MGEVGVGGWGEDVDELGDSDIPPLVDCYCAPPPGGGKQNNLFEV